MSRVRPDADWAPGKREPLKPGERFVTAFYIFGVGDKRWSEEMDFIAHRDASDREIKETAREWAAENLTDMPDEIELGTASFGVIQF